MKPAILLAVLLIGLTVTMVFIGYYINITNTEVRLHNQINAQELNIESYYDKMFKILKQKAGVTNEYQKNFKDIYIGIMEGRYSDGGGGLMKWIQESNPNFDASLYKDLMASIEIEREGFHNEQKIMLDLVREHTNMLETIPSKFVLYGVDKINYVVISSTTAKDMMKSRVEDDVELFSSK